MITRTRRNPKSACDWTCLPRPTRSSLRQTTRRSQLPAETDGYLDFSPNGRSLACGGDFNELFLCESGTWSQTQRIPIRSECLCVAFANNRNLLASGHTNGFIQIMDASDGRLICQRSSSGEVRSLAWSQDDQLLVSSHGDGTQRVWHVPTATQLGILVTIRRIRRGANASLFDSFHLPGSFAPSGSERRENESTATTGRQH